jgi:hypothetical protein
MSTQYTEELVRSAAGLPLTPDEVQPDYGYKPVAVDSDALQAIRAIEEVHVYCDNDECNTGHSVPHPPVENLICRS